MSNSNLPIGTANDMLAPWNQDNQEISFEMPVREVYSLCCGHDAKEGDTHCGDCGHKAMIYVEPIKDFNKRVEQAQENAYFEHINKMYDECE